MSILTIDPTHWTANRLAAFDHEALHELTLKVAGTHHAYQLVLGRCLLAVHRSKLYQKFGCSGAVHYGVLILGLSTQKARTLRWVAEKLESLPLLSLAAQSGQVSYSKVREVVRKATPDTEAFWLELCRSKTYRQLEVLVGHTPEGGIPGDLPADDGREPDLCSLRLSLGPTARAVIDRGLQAYSLKVGRPVPLAEAVEAMFATLLEKDKDDDILALAKAQKEARRDLLAQQSRRNPLVQEARQIAEAMGESERAEYRGELSNGADQLLAQATAIAGEVHHTFPTREISEASANLLKINDQFPGRETLEEPGDLLKINDEFPAREILDEPGVLLKNTGEFPARETRWQNLRLKFNPEARLPTPAQRRELLRRDGYCCSTPGCPNHLWLEIHHIVPYSKNGKTLPNSLITLCSRCHKNVHEKRLTISGGDRFEFRDSHGHDLARQYDLSVASWLDFRIGWRGSEDNSYHHRACSELVAT